MAVKFAVLEYQELHMAGSNGRSGTEVEEGMDEVIGTLRSSATLKRSVWCPVCTDQQLSYQRMCFAGIGN